MSLELLDAARQAMAAGDHAAALAKLIAFYDSAAVTSPVRNSYCLASFIELARLHPPARTTLAQMRDARAAAIGAGEHASDLLRDVLAMDEHLEDSAHSLRLMLRLHQEQPRLVAVHKDDALQVFMRGGEFALARSYLGDPIRELQHVAEVQNRIGAHQRRNGGPAWQQLSNVQRYIDRLHLITGILHAQGEERLATEVLVLAPGMLESAEERAILDQEYEQPGSVQRALDAALAAL